MTLRTLVAVLCLFAAAGCNRDPKVVAQKYVQTGNKYFDRGKYKEASIMYRKALTKDLRSAEAYYRLGLAQLKLGGITDAIGAFQRAGGEKGAFAADARKELAELYVTLYSMRVRNYEKLVPDMQALANQIAASDPKSPYSYRLKGYISMVRDRDYKAATAQFRKAYELNPQPEFASSLAQSLMSDNQAEEGVRVAREAIAKWRTYAPSYQLLYAYYLTRNQSQQAESILKEAVAAIPRNQDLILQLAGYYYAAQRPDDLKKTLDRLVADPKTFPEGRRLAANFYRGIGKYDEAIRIDEDGIKADPSRKNQYRTQLAEVLMQAGKPADALKVLDELLKDNPKDQNAKGLRAAVQLDLGDPNSIQAAVADLRAAVTSDPKDARMRYELARGLLLKRPPEVEQAKTELNQAIQLKQDLIAARVLLAEVHLRTRQLGPALDQAREVLRIQPRNLQARLITSAALAGMGNLGEARASLTETLKTYPRSKEAAMQLAALDLAERKYRDAELQFGKIYTGTGDFRGLIGLSETYAAQNEYDKAIGLLQTEVKKNPQNPALRFALANLQVRGNHYDDAISGYQSLIQEKPKDQRNYDVYLNLGETYRKKGDTQSAMANFRAAKDLKPGDPKAYLPLALLLDGSGKKDEAKSLYEQILKMQPDNPIALNNLAYILAESGGNLDQALTLAQRAKQRLPQDPNVSDTLGWIYIRKNLNDNAIEILRDLVNRYPDSPTFRYHLAMAFTQKGDKVQARKELQTALSKKPGKDEEGRIRDLMAKIG